MSEALAPVFAERDSSRSQRDELWGSSHLPLHDGHRLNHQTDSFCEEWSHFVGDEETSNNGGYAGCGNQLHDGTTQATAVSTAPPPTTTEHNTVVLELPPQLHPAVSESMKRISSCYFSIHSTSTSNVAGLNRRNGSLADIFSFLDCQDFDEASLGSASKHPSNASLSDYSGRWSGALVEDLLYHDILMTLFGYLDIDSLAAFSETARRPNFEVFYYLQLQLQRALLPSTAEDHGLSPIAGTTHLARLARTDYTTAEQVVQGYLDSNTSLQQMPLRHSLEYIRQVLMRRNVLKNAIGMDGIQLQEQHQQHTGQDASLFKGAALLIALIGAASFMNSDAMMHVDSFMPPAAELPNMLFRVGFVGSLMSAVRSFATRASHHNSESQSHNNSRGGDMQQPAALMKQQAEQFANNMMSIFAALSDDTGEKQGESQQQTMTSSVHAVMIRMMRTAYATASGQVGNHGRPVQRRSRSMLLSPNPYDHLPPTLEEKEGNVDEPLWSNQQLPCASAGGCSCSSPEQGLTDSDENFDETNLNKPAILLKETQTEEPERKVPTGCVGAYKRATSQATTKLVEFVKDERLRKYKNMDDDEQRRLGTALLDACASDDGLENVKSIILGGIDVEDFYVASDGTETSALHAAAFHGSSSVLAYLCLGLEDEYDKDDSVDTTRCNDGGLCQVNLRDPNGWTALHFAAGTNSTECIRILAQHGADLTIEAANGYTPLQWANRLQNKAVAEELRQILSKQKDGQKKKPLIFPRFLFATTRTH